MKQLCSALPAVLAACLLQACGSLPPKAGLAMQPVLRLSDSDGLDAPALYQLGRFHQQRGELAAAGAAFGRSIALAPRQLDARNALAVLLAGRGETEAASALLRQVVADFPDQAQPRSNLGYVYFLQGRPQAARDQLEQALALAPGHAQARANLALLPPAAAGAAPSAATTALAAASGAESLPSTPVAGAIREAPARLQVVQLAANEFRLQASAMAPAATPATVAVADVQIVNGNGVAGIGEHVRRLLARHGIADARVVNQRRHYQRTTIIEYLPGQHDRALAMQAALNGRARLLAARALPGPITLRLVLGRDNSALAGRLAATGIDAGRDSGRAPAMLLAAVTGADEPYFNQE